MRHRPGGSIALRGAGDSTNRLTSGSIGVEVNGRKEANVSMSSLKLFAVAVLMLGALTAACDGPCTNLAEMICACEPNETLERACLLNVDRSTRDPVEEDEARCEELMQTCTCAALERNDFAACGLTLDGEADG